MEDGDYVGNGTSIAQTVFNTYNKLPAGGKPRSMQEFTVLASIVASFPRTNRATSDSDNYEHVTISLATGTKCIGSDLAARDKAGRLLRDSHAEVLARRGLLRHLLITAKDLMRMERERGAKETQIEEKNGQGLTFAERDSESETQSLSRYCLLERCPSFPDTAVKRGSIYRLRPDVHLSLYVSDSPCGDASIYATLSGDQAFTGAKRLAGSSGTIESTQSIPNRSSCQNCVKEGEKETILGTEVVREGGAQALSVVRLKSGRSDLSLALRTQSMSCSDKIARWTILGLQGSLAVPLLGRIPIGGLVVGADPQGERESQIVALKRAFHDRIGCECSSLPTLSLLPIDVCVFASAKAVVKHRLTKTLIGEEGESTEGERVTKKQKTNPTGPLPCGSSVNWQRDSPFISHSLVKEREGERDKKGKKAVSVAGGTVEVTIAHSGLPQGSSLEHVLTSTGNSDSKRVESESDSIRDSDRCSDVTSNNGNHSGKKKPLNGGQCSRLTSYSLSQLLSEVQALVSEEESEGDNWEREDYRVWKRKQVDALYREKRDSSGDIVRIEEVDRYKEQEEYFFNDHPIFKEWLRSSCNR